MSHLFVREGGAWRCEPLGAEGLALVRGDLRIVRSGAGAAEAFVLIVSDATPVRRNGTSLLAGVVALAHGDEIRVRGGARFFFSAERPASVEPCPREDAPPCPRCRQPIAFASPAVSCPGCAVWSHQCEQLACFTYTDCCAACGAATELGGALRFVPEEDGSA